MSNGQIKAWLILILVGGTIIGIAKNPASSPPTAETKAPETGCRTDWHLCKDNLDLLTHYDKVFDMQYDCKAETNKLVQWGDAQWTWEYFNATNHGTDAVEYGVMSLIDTDVKMQNQFGAYGHAKVVCNVDLATGKVVSVNAY